VIQSIKELIVVLIISIGVFKLVQPVAHRYCLESDFKNRRNVWLILTCAVFLAPNFWVFVFVATPLLIRLGRQDSNPAAAFLFLLFLLPAVSVRIPMIGLSFLINLDFHLLLTFCLLVPAARSFWKDKNGLAEPGLRATDVLLLAYCLLTSFVFVLPEIGRGILMDKTFTDCLRRLISISFGLFVPYFVISRTSTNRAAVNDMIASFSIKCALLATVAIFEGSRHWLLYGEVRSRWGEGAGGYLGRGGDIRAMASTGHPLLLGYLLALAFGFWLYLQQGVESRASRIMITGLFLFGLVASYSRGPWMAAIFIYFAFAALGPRGMTRSFKAAAITSLLGLAVAISPLGKKVASVIPYFGGTVDIGNIEYRDKLFARSWEIIMNQPWFGDQRALLKMESLRQGEGIIDLINGYIIILLNNGFVGLSLFLGFVLIASFRAYKVSARAGASDPELGKLGACLVACTLGALLLTWGAGLNELMYCVLVGLMVAYVDASRRLPSGRKLPVLVRPGAGHPG
jgi:O-antigen ligase